MLRWRRKRTSQTRRSSMQPPQVLPALHPVGFPGGSTK
jgi:hypothetical protein